MSKGTIPAAKDRSSEYRIARIKAKGYSQIASMIRGHRPLADLIDPVTLKVYLKAGIPLTDKALYACPKHLWRYINLTDDIKARIISDLDAIDIKVAWRKTL